MTPEILHRTKTDHYCKLLTGLSEFIMIGALHAIAPFNELLGHAIGLIAFGVYVLISYTHIRHSIIMIKNPSL